MKIGKKLFAAFLIMIALVLIVGAIGYYSLNETKHWWKNAEQKGLTVLRLSDDIQISILNTRRAEKDFLLRYKAKGISAAKDEYITNKL